MTTLWTEAAKRSRRWADLRSHLRSAGEVALDALIGTLEEASGDVRFGAYRVGLKQLADRGKEWLLPASGSALELQSIAESTRFSEDVGSARLELVFRELLCDYDEGIREFSDPARQGDLESLSAFLATQYPRYVQALVASNDVLVQRWREKSLQLLRGALADLDRGQNEILAVVSALGVGLAEARARLESIQGVIAKPPGANALVSEGLSEWLAERRTQKQKEDDRRRKLLEKYRDHLRRSLSKELNVPEGARKTLAEVWVTPTLSSEGPASSPVEPTSGPLVLAIEAAQAKDQQSNRAWVVLGEPGAGKTSLLQAITLEFLREENRATCPLPILVALAEWEEGDAFDQAARATEGEIGHEHATELAEVLRHEAHDGRIWLFLDGIDEVDAKLWERRKTSLRFRSLDSGDQEEPTYLRDFPGLTIVATTRPTGYDVPGKVQGMRSNEDRRLDGWAHLQLDPLDETDQAELWARLAERVPGSQSLLGVAQEDPTLGERLGNPLFLTILAEHVIQAPGKGLPSSLRELYDFTLNRLLNAAHDPRRLEHRKWEVSSLRQIMRRLAWTVLRDGHPSLSEDLVRKELQAWARDSGTTLSHEDSRTLVSDLKASALLGSPLSSQVHLRFTHRTYAEFLAGEWLAQHPADREIFLGKLAEEGGIANFGNTAKFLLACLEDAPSFFEEIRARVEDSAFLRSLIPETPWRNYEQGLQALLATEPWDGTDLLRLIRASLRRDPQSRPLRASVLGETLKMVPKLQDLPPKSNPAADPWLDTSAAVDRYVEYYEALSDQEFEDWAGRAKNLVDLKSLAESAVAARKKSGASFWPRPDLDRQGHVAFALQEAGLLAEPGSEDETLRLRRNFLTAADLPILSAAVDAVTIPGGTYQRGSPEGEPGRSANEGPLWPVEISRFRLGEVPVTNEQFAALVGVEVPEAGAKWPVVFVSWWEAYLFAFWVGGRLPTESEWEYACRAGNEEPYWFGSDPERLSAHAWFNENSSDPRKDVGAAGHRNPFGLVDMHGLVWEWCSDVYARYPKLRAATATPGTLTNPQGPKRGPLVEGSVLRVQRGGSFRLDAAGCRSAARNWGRPGGALGSVGFRVAFPAPELGT